MIDRGRRCPGEMWNDCGTVFQNNIGTDAAIADLQSIAEGRGDAGKLAAAELRRRSPDK